MDADSWSARFSSLSKRYQSALQSRSDLFLGFEEIDGDDDIREEFPCPFCSEFFDIVGLCCHIDDEHPVEAKNGVCPVCAMRVGVDMVAHITLQHGSVFKMQRKRRSSKGGSHSSLSLLRKELREGNLQSLLGSSYIASSNNAVPDSLLSSFILPMSDEHVNLQSHSSADATFMKKGKDESTLKSEVGGSGDPVTTFQINRELLGSFAPQIPYFMANGHHHASSFHLYFPLSLNVKSPPLSIKDQEERARRSGFVHELLLSTILDDTL